MDHRRSGWTRRCAGRCASALLCTLATLGMFALAEPALALADEGKAQSAPSAPVDINKATVDELTTLPGIGATMARRIVAFREEHGPFRRVEDLLKVKGIGEKSFEKLRPHVKVSRGR